MCCEILCAAGVERRWMFTRLTGGNVQSLMLMARMHVVLCHADPCIP